MGRQITVTEYDDGTADVVFKPEYEVIVCDDWEQALECAAYGVPYEGED